MRFQRQIVGPTAGLMAGALLGGLVYAQPATSPKPSPNVKAPSETPQRAGPGQIDLRPKFRTGQVMKYTFDQTAHNTIKSQDPSDNSMDQDQKQTERIGLTMKVVQAGDDGTTLQVVYDSIKITLDTPDGPAEYDSTKTAGKKATPTSPSGRRPAGKPAGGSPSSDPLKDLGDLDMNGMLGMIAGPMVGTTITVKTDKSGAITSVSGGEALGGSMGGLGGMGGMGAGLMPSPSAMANWLTAGVGGKPFARVGETWTNNDAMSGTPVGSFSMTTKHTLKSASGGVANISFTGGIEPSSQAAQPGGGGGLAQVQSATYTGTYAWDTNSGSLREMGSNMRVALEGGLMGGKMRMNSETQVKVRREQQ